MHSKNPLTLEEFSVSPPFWREDRCRWSNWSRAKRRTSTLHREKIREDHLVDSFFKKKSSNQLQKGKMLKIWTADVVKPTSEPLPSTAWPLLTWKNTKIFKYRQTSDTSAAVVFILEEMHSRCDRSERRASFCYFSLLSGHCRSSPSWHMEISLRLAELPHAASSPPKLCFTYLMKQMRLSKATSLLHSCWRLCQSESSCWKMNATQLRCACGPFLFIRGSGNYLLTRRLNKRSAINNYKQLYKSRNLNLCVGLLLIWTKSKFYLKLCNYKSCEVIITFLPLWKREFLR